MAKILPFLTARTHVTERYISVRRGGHSPIVRVRDADAHRAMLASQLEQIWRTAAKRGPDERDPAAQNEIIAIRPGEGGDLPSDSFGDSRSGIRVISKDPDTGIVLVDAPGPYLGPFRKKLDAYADDELVSAKTGARRGERALNPVDELRLAEPEDRMGLALQRAVLAGEIEPGTLAWMELGCRGGRRALTMDTYRSKLQIERTLAKLGREAPIEFLAAEQVIFFVRITLNDLRTLVRATDCIFEVDLVSTACRDWLLFEHTTLPTPDFLRFALTPPRSDASVVTILDTGVASSHPMLASAMLDGHTVVPGDTSPEDLHGHGTLMAGVALHEDVGGSIERNSANATHWIESVKLLTSPQTGTAADDRMALWPVLTQRAIDVAETNGPRRRVFTMAVTAPLEDGSRATSWSHGVDQFAFNDGAGRLICVSIGSCDDGLDPLFVEGYPHMNLQRVLDDPAHAFNALTVGAYTEKVELRPEQREDAGWYPLAPAGGVSPFTRAGIRGAAIKPDVVFEGGNLACDGTLAWNSEATLSTLSTGRDVLRQPLGVHCATSAATAHAGRFAARVWDARPDLRPETVRGLLVHSAQWTPMMERQLPNLEERLRLCGYGVPDLSYATECLSSRATILVEDAMPNAVQVVVEDGEERRQRVVKYVRVPIPEDLFLAGADEEVDLRVTLSSFAEPSMFRKTEVLGLRLGWDMQGPTESPEEFRARINSVVRDEESSKGSYQKTSGFKRWQIGKERRSRGTVQSDRLRVPASLLAGEKWIAVYPVLGWWEDRNSTREEELAYSLIVTLESPGKDVYTLIAQALAATVEVDAT